MSERSIRRSSSSRTAVFIFAVVAFASASAAALADETPGNTAGLFVVEDARENFDALKHHGEALAWRNPENLGAPDPSDRDHYQGVVRLPRTGLPVFYVSQFDDDDGGIGGGYIHVVTFGLRPRTGERLGSNLQQYGNDTEEAYPPMRDTWQRSIRLDGSFAIDGVTLPAYNHPGSMALVDDILFVPMDQPTSESAPIGQIVLFDVAGDSINPVPIQALPIDHAIDNVAVTRLDDGTWRIWANGGGGAAIKIYDTTLSDLRDDDLALTLVQSWDAATDLIGNQDWPTGTGAHQSSTFLREPDGDLFMIGMRHPGGLPFAGDDYADLYSVEESASGRIVLRHLRTKNLFCVYDGGGGPADMRICNMAAANNAYVSPSGELILYSIPHDDEDGFDPDIVRMGEFRHRDVNREGSPLRDPRADAGGAYTVDEGALVALAGSGRAPLDRPWVELYDDSGFQDRSIVVDYDFRGFLELDNFNNLDNFNDKTSSVRWRAPVGVSITLYDDDNFEDRRVVLRGTGRTEEVSSLENQGVVPGLVEQREPSKDPGEALDFNDKTSSLRWSGSVPDLGEFDLRWDLDGDEFFGEEGSSARYGDETGGTPTFDATALDGPIDVEVVLRASAPGSPAAEDTSLVRVVNVPPAVSIDTLDGGRPGVGVAGCPVLLEGSFSDVPADRHDASVAWGDGVTASAALDAASSTVSATHFFSSAGTFDVELSVTDDDGGVGTDVATIDVAVDEVPPTVVVDRSSTGVLFPLVGISLGDLFTSDDDDEQPGGVVHERVTLNGCTVLDGDETGDADGLLNDETVTIDLAFLCDAAATCGFDVLPTPTLAVEASDCAGNVGVDAIRFGGSATLVPSVCGTTPETPWRGRGLREGPRSAPRVEETPSRVRHVRTRGVTERRGDAASNRRTEGRAHRGAAARPGRSARDEPGPRRPGHDGSRQR